MPDFSFIAPTEEEIEKDSLGEGTQNYPEPYPTRPIDDMSAEPPRDDDAMRGIAAAVLAEKKKKLFEAATKYMKSRRAGLEQGQGQGREQTPEQGRESGRERLESVRQAITNIKQNAA
ncbi:MAG: hypothetical protein LBH41_02125 [Rickettsiales bacterium]|jgi:flagellar biosynthesis/type III secretory pathway protein FliH|nr:hypothetical protein [Rickettsiales bacterium]